MKKIKPGECVIVEGNPLEIVQKEQMNLLDYFAAAALQGLLANPKLDREIMRNGGARGGWIEGSAYGFANAMMVERQNYLKKEDN